MGTNRHGISVGIERIADHFYLSLKANGKLTHDDYERIVPTIEASLNSVENPHIKAIVDIREFEGWDEIAAVWDELRFGLAHNSEFEKIAIIGKENWHKIATKVASWFTSGEIRYFEDLDEALNWI